MVEKDFLDYLEKQSIKELHDMTERINRNKFPENYEAILRRIDFLENTDNFLTNSISVNKNTELTQTDIDDEDFLEESTSLNPTTALDDANGKIKRGWIAGVIYASIVLIGYIVAMNSHENSILSDYFGVWSILDSAIVYALSYGIYKNNKLSVIALLVYFFLPKLIVYLDTGNARALSGGAIFLYFFVQCYRGMSEYHKLMAKEASESQTV